MITAEQLKHIVPEAKPANIELYAGLLSLLMPKYGIDTKERMAPFLANVAHESGSFNYTRELASGSAYEGRADMGNTHPGDGMKYKGRGLIQITFFNGYKDCSFAIYGDNRLILHPETLEEPGPATESACWFWSKYKSINAICDKPDDWIKPGVHGYTKWQWIVVLVNGPGMNHMEERTEFLKRALEVL